MVARVPLFSRLTAGDIAHIMQLLKAAQVERGEVIIRHGKRLTACTLIAEGSRSVAEYKARTHHSARGSLFLASGQYCREERDPRR